MAAAAPIDRPSACRYGPRAERPTCVVLRRSGTLLLAAAACMACSLARAADLEVLPAESAIYVPTYFQWGGIYVGGYLGGGLGTADWAEGSPITVGNTTFLFPSVNASMR